MISHKIIVFAIYTVKPGKMPELIEKASKMAEFSRQEKGNLLYNFFSSSVDENKLFLYEEYLDQASLNAHRNSSYFNEIVVEQIIPILENREVFILDNPINTPCTYKINPLS